MRLFSLTFIVLAAVCRSTCSGQEPASYCTQEVTFECEVDRSIPNPSDLLSLASFLKNESVAKALDLSADQKQEMESLLKASSGSLSLVSIKVVGNQLPSDDEIDRYADEVKRERTIAFEEILDPMQRDRLQQIAYRVEIERVGIVQALTKGFLGEGIGIEDYQRGPLEIVASSLESQLVSQIRSIRQSYLDSLASELSDDEQSKLKEILGKSFFFREDQSLRRFERKGTLPSGNQAAIPDPSSIVALVALIENESVAIELGISPEQADRLRDLHHNSRGPLIAAGRRFPALKSTIDSEIKDKVTSILTDEQQSRLRQLAYHIEIERVGFTESFSSGFLGEKVGGSPKRRAILTEKCSALETQCYNQINHLTKLAVERILKELTGPQRERALTLLGPSFEYRELARRQL